MSTEPSSSTDGHAHLKRRDFLRRAGAGAAGAGLLGTAACGSAEETAGSSAGAVSGPRVNWRLATSFPQSLDIIHGAGQQVADIVSELTGGQFTMRVYAAGEIVPALQVMDAVQQGSVEIGHTAAYYYVEDYASALRDWGAVIRLEPGSAAAYGNRAWTHCRLGQADKGLSDAAQALRLKPYGDGYAARACNHGVSGNVPAAIRDYEKALSLSPDHDEASDWRRAIDRLRRRK